MLFEFKYNFLRMSVDIPNALSAKANTIINRNFWKYLMPNFLWYDTDRTEKGAFNNSSIAVCVRCRDNVYTELLYSNMHIQTQRLMEGIYEAVRWDGLRCHDI
jgi:hypothetical protein